MEPADNSINYLGRLFVAAVALTGLVLATLVAVVALLFVVRGQNDDNQRHTDCVVAAWATAPPEYCVAVIEHLIEEGIVERPDLTSVP